MARRKDVFTPEQKDEICAHVLVNVASGRFVSRIFREDKTTATGIKLPNQATFYQWVFQDSTGELDEKLARAREFGIEVKLDECEDIADEGINDTFTDADGFQRTNIEVIQRSKLRVETRIKLAQMMKPKKYGAKLDVTSDGKALGLSEAMRAAEKRITDA